MKIKKTCDSAITFKQNNTNRIGGSIEADRIAYLTEILDRQFVVLQVNEMRANSIIAIDASFIAGIVLLNQFYVTKGSTIAILLFAAITLLIISLAMELGFVIPRLDAKIGGDTNLRGTIGICKLDKESYYKRVDSLKYDEMIKLLSYQISGMARNNKRGARYLLMGIIPAILSFVPLMFAMGFTFIQ